MRTLLLGWSHSNNEHPCVYHITCVLWGVQLPEALRSIPNVLLPRSWLTPFTVILSATCRQQQHNLWFRFLPGPVRWTALPVAVIAHTGHAVVFSFDGTWAPHQQLKSHAEQGWNSTDWSWHPCTWQQLLRLHDLSLGVQDAMLLPTPGSRSTRDALTLHIPQIKR